VRKPVSIEAGAGYFTHTHAESPPPERWTTGWEPDANTESKLETIRKKKAYGI
jgi:hypothetical protein